jgi:hypothetical protein
MESDDPRELERKIEQASRIASRLTDQTTVERLWAWIEGLKQNLRQRRRQPILSIRRQAL